MHVLQNREVCLLQIRSINGGFWNTDQLKEERPERKEKRTDLHSGIFWGTNACWVFGAGRALFTCNESPTFTAMPVSTISEYPSLLSPVHVCVCVCVCVVGGCRGRLGWGVIMKNTLNFQCLKLVSILSQNEVVLIFSHTAVLCPKDSTAIKDDLLWSLYYVWGLYLTCYNPMCPSDHFVW